MIGELRQRFRAALIDEFQDTDQQQWFIFSSLFSAPEQSLYLIGDPKQAIYKFRGADIYSYFDAQRQAQHHFTLGRNWRSHPQLVEAVNQLFEKPKPFLFPQLDFKPVEAALADADGAIYHDDEVLAPLLLWQLGENDGNRAHWSSGKAGTAILHGVVAEILQLLNRPYLIRIRADERRLRPRDIAILVRTNPQARRYQQALAEVGVPAVLNSKESVFASAEAFDLYRVLQAVAQPGPDGELVRPGRPTIVPAGQRRNRAGRMGQPVSGLSAAVAARRTDEHAAAIVPSGKRGGASGRIAVGGKGADQSASFDRVAATGGD